MPDQDRSATTPNWVERPTITSGYLDTVGELRRFLAPFDDDCPLRGDLQIAFTLDLRRGSYLTATTDGEPRRIPHELSVFADEPCEDDTEGMFNHQGCNGSREVQNDA